MRTRTRSSLIAAAAAAALAIAGCGDDDDGTSGAGAGAANGVDRAFVQEMIPHHESAVAMAEIAAERAESSFVRELAADIAATQAKEIAVLRAEDRELAEAGVEPGDLGVPSHEMGMDDDPDELRTADPFDEAFVRMMIPHHEGAVTMARALLERGGDPELRSLAEAIVEAQEAEIEAMHEHLGDDAAPMDDHGGGEAHSG